MQKHDQCYLSDSSADIIVILLSALDDETSLSLPVDLCGNVSGKWYSTLMSLYLTGLCMYAILHDVAGEVDQHTRFNCRQENHTKAGMLHTEPMTKSET